MKATVQLNQTDEQLIQGYLCGDNNALGILYNRYYKKVFHKCLSFAKNTDDAFDFAQEVLMKAFVNAGSFKGESKFSTWLFSITHNYCITQIAKNNKEYNLIENIQYNLSRGGNEVEELEERQKHEDQELKLNNYLNELTEMDRSILELKYRHNYTIKDLQDKYDLSASAVKMRLMRARQKVGQLYHN